MIAPGEIRLSPTMPRQMPVLPDGKLWPHLSPPGMLGYRWGLGL
jgi:hypothetical protein